MADMQNDPADQDATTITIAVNPDKTFTVTISGDSDNQDSKTAPDAQGNPDAGDDQPQTVKTVDEVLQLVQQELTEDDSGAAAWQAEAAGRDASGQRVAPGGGMPQMSM